MKERSAELQRGDAAWYIMHPHIKFLRVWDIIQVRTDAIAGQPQSFSPAFPRAFSEYAVYIP